MDGNRKRTIFAKIFRMFTAIILVLKGIVMGLTVSAPIGPNAIMCVNRTLQKGRISGFFSGMGIATADTLFAIMAGLGLGFIINFIEEQRFILGIIAGVIVLLLGLNVFLSNPVKAFRQRDKSGSNLFEDFVSILGLALTNPVSIFLFIAFFSGSALENEGTRFFLFYLISGVFVGAVLWWFMFSSLVSRFRRNLRLRNLVKINKITGIVLIIIGVVALAAVFTTY